MQTNQDQYYQGQLDLIDKLLKVRNGRLLDGANWRSLLKNERAYIRSNKNESILEEVLRTR
jgi:hypothetical protein